MRNLIATTLLLAGLIGCGQKGPLYLPQEQPQDGGNATNTIVNDANP